MKVVRATFLVARTASLVAVLRSLTRGGTSAAPLTASDAAVDRPSISVVVPARDESGRIGPLLRVLALMEESGDVDEVIVVDDGSTDDTAVLANATGARVVSAVRLPSGWLGKPWAIEQGVAAAVGEWIVTLDADTRPARALATAAVARCVADNIDLLTLAPTTHCPTLGAAWLHPSMLTTLVYRFGRPGTVVAPQHVLGEWAVHGVSARLVHFSRRVRRRSKRH